MVFYFTELATACTVAKQLEGSPISIPQVMRQENMAFAADAIGVVAPVYGHESASYGEGVLEKATFQTEYFYMILYLWKPAWRCRRTGPSALPAMRHSGSLYQCGADGR